MGVEASGNVDLSCQSPEIQIDEKAVARVLALIKFEKSEKEPSFIGEVTEGIRTIFRLHADGSTISSLRPEHLRWYLEGNLGSISIKFLRDDEDKFNLRNPYHVLAYAGYLTDAAAVSEPTGFELDQFREF